MGTGGKIHVETDEKQTAAREFALLFVIPEGPALILGGGAISPIDTAVHYHRSWARIRSKPPVVFIEWEELDSLKSKMSIWGLKNYRQFVRHGKPMKTRDNTRLITRYESIRKQVWAINFCLNLFFKI